jgi:LacI family transcriptional regulator
VAVIGCGNLRLSSYLEVPLSTIDQSAQEQGEEAANLALSLITQKQKRRAKHLLLEPKLIVRDSTVR